MKFKREKNGGEPHGINRLYFYCSMFFVITDLSATTVTPNMTYIMPSTATSTSIAVSSTDFHGNIESSSISPVVTKETLISTFSFIDTSTINGTNSENPSVNVTAASPIVTSSSHASKAYIFLSSIVDGNGNKASPTVIATSTFASGTTDLSYSAQFVIEASSVVGHLLNESSTPEFFTTTATSKTNTFLQNNLSVIQKPAILETSSAVSSTVLKVPFDTSVTYATPSIDNLTTTDNNSFRTSVDTSLESSVVITSTDASISPNNVTVQITSFNISPSTVISQLTTNVTPMTGLSISDVSTYPTTEVSYTAFSTSTALPATTENDTLSSTNSTNTTWTNTEMFTANATSTTKLPTANVTSTTKVPIANVTSTNEVPTANDAQTREVHTSRITSTTEVPTTDDTSTTEVPTTTVTSTTEVSTTNDTSTTAVPTTAVTSTTEVPTTDVNLTNMMSTTDSNLTLTDFNWTTEVSTTDDMSTSEVPTTTVASTTEVSTTDDTSTTAVPTTAVNSTTEVPTTDVNLTNMMSTTDGNLTLTDFNWTTEVSTTDFNWTTEMPTTSVNWPSVLSTTSLIWTTSSPVPSANISIAKYGSSILGSSLKLSCSVSNLYLIGNISGVVLTWRKDQTEIKPRKNDRRKILPLNCTVSRPYFCVSSLTISNLISLDEGDYSCSYTWMINTVTESTFVTIFEKPRISISPLLNFAFKGHPINFTCRILNYDEIDAEAKTHTFNWTIENNSNYNITTDFKGTSSILIIASKTNVSCSYGEARTHAGVTIFEKGNNACKSQEADGYIWPEIPVDNKASHDCSEGYTGIVVRKCDNNGNWMKTDFSKCENNELKKAEESVKIINNLTVVDVGTFTTVLDDIHGVVNTSQKQSTELDIQNIVKSVSIIEKISSANVSITNQEEAEQTAKSLVSVVDTVLQKSDILKVNNEKDDKKISQSKSTATMLVKSMEEFGNKISSGLSEDENVTVSKANIVMVIKKAKAAKIKFPPDNIGNREDRTSAFTLPDGAVNSDKGITYSAVKYTSLGSLLSYEVQERRVNSDILSLTLVGLDNKIKKNLSLTFQHKEDDLTTPMCSYLNVTSGLWLSDGCSKDDSKSNEYLTICSCSHLTNFAILMSSATPSAEDYERLRLITIVGCSFSIVGAVLTIAVYIRLWRYVKSRRSVLVIHLCLALTVAYLLFLLGVEHSETKTGCTIIASLLQYFFLAMFCVMLSLGIDLAVAILRVFKRRSSSALLLLLSWGLPVIIVGTSLGATRLKGYGDGKYCWLEGTTIYGFLVPVSLIIFVNVIIVILVMKVMYSSKFMLRKSVKEKTVSGIRSMFALLPILGLTWIFGILAINEDFIICQYLFAIFNSLQGLFIFLFHSVLNTSVRKGLQQKIKQYESRKTSYLQSPRTNLTSKGHSLSEGRALKEGDFPTDDKGSDAYTLPRLNFQRL